MKGRRIGSFWEFDEISDTGLSEELASTPVVVLMLFGDEDSFSRHCCLKCDALVPR